MWTVSEVNLHVTKVSWLHTVLNCVFITASATLPHFSILSLLQKHRQPSYMVIEQIRFDRYVSRYKDQLECLKLQNHCVDATGDLGKEGLKRWVFSRFLNTVVTTWRSVHSVQQLGSSDRKHSIADVWKTCALNNKWELYVVVLYENSAESHPAACAWWLYSIGLMCCALQVRRRCWWLTPLPSWQPRLRAKRPSQLKHMPELSEWFEHISLFYETDF